MCAYISKNMLTLDQIVALTVHQVLTLSEERNLSAVSLKPMLVHAVKVFMVYVKIKHAPLKMLSAVLQDRPRTGKSILAAPECCMRSCRMAINQECPATTTMQNTKQCIENQIRNHR